MAKSVLTNQQKNRIYELSTEDGFSQSKLAELYGVSQPTIHNALKEKRYEAKEKEYKDAIGNAMIRGIKSAIQDGEISFSNNAYIEKAD